jgi:hypothetical protein
MRALLLVLLLDTAVNSALPAGEPAAPETAHPPPPCHLVDVWWDIAQDRAFESCSLDVTIAGDVPGSVDLRIAPIGPGYLNKTAFQGGLRTRAEDDTVADRRRRAIGPGFVFSMWGERSHEAIRVAPGGFSQGSGTEGGLGSALRPYLWSQGKYTYEVVRMDSVEVAGAPFTWVGAFVHSHDKKEDVFVGALRFPGKNLVLARQLGSFVEIDGPPRSVGDIPGLTVTLGDLRVNGKPVDGPTALAEYPEGVLDGAEARGQGTSVVITLGRLVKDRTRRRVDLIGSAPGGGQGTATTAGKDLLIGKFDLLATYTYAKGLRDGLSRGEAKLRGITAAVMGSRTRGASRGGPRGQVESKHTGEKAPKSKQPLTAEVFDQQVAGKLGPYFDEVFLPTMRQLVAARLSYEKVKEILAMPPAVGAKIRADQFERRASAFLRKSSGR